MRYVALLRGVNVGGNGKVDMAGLKAAFEAAGLARVRTYINSGNVVFSTDLDRAGLVRAVCAATRRHAGFEVDLLVRSADEMRTVAAAIPASWRNDTTMKCDVVFLPDDLDGVSVAAELGPRAGIEDVVTPPGALVWRVDRAHASSSRLIRIVGTPLYRRVTVRNCNTVRKLAALAGDEG